MVLAPVLAIALHHATAGDRRPHLVAARALAGRAHPVPDHRQAGLDHPRAGIRLVEGALSYHIIRGRLSAWRGVDGVLDLGPVQMLGTKIHGTSLDEEPSPDMPAVGEGFFYLIQQVTARGAVGYGTESASWPRVPDTVTAGTGSATQGSGPARR